MVSYYHQVYSHTVFSLTHSPIHVIPVNTSMVSYYHQVFSLSLTHTLSHPCHPCEHFHGVVLPPSLPLTLSSHTHTHSPTHVIPVNTSMVSYYHQVYPLTALRELVLPLTLPWCRTTTKSSHTHTNPCAPTHSHVLTHSAPLTSFHLILTTNSSQLLSHTLPPIMPPSHHHHFLSPITTYHHQSLPLTPHNTPNPSISLPTLPIVS